jgi:hypothetical protein
VRASVELGRRESFQPAFRVLDHVDKIPFEFFRVSSESLNDGVEQDRSVV